ncbi:site-specific integrase [Massilibacteroides vaginae]|uniref:site-specific integrase n=1 Tax=Massilibacteroides vaginae TaxID=1673718 RepID=UPI000A1C8621|nr:site-specific integrase [Massilibacteroides vaginae]
MDSLVLRFIFDRKGVTKREPKKEALIQIEVYDKISRKKKYISTGEYILRSQYSPVGTGGLSIIKHSNASIIKNRIDKTFSKIQAFVYSDKCQFLEDVDKWNKEDDLSTPSIVEFIKADLTKRNASSSSIKHSYALIKRLEEFGKIKSFSDLSYVNIEGFDFHLKKTIKSQPTLYKRHTLFKSYINKAIKIGYIDVNPYDNFTVRRGKSEDPVYLIESEVQKIIKYNPKGSTKESLSKVKDLFLFQCFTGLSYTDLDSFSRGNIRIINGQKEIHGVRNKTGVPFIVLLLPIAEEIAERYNYNLPVISNQKYNTYLNTLIERVGLDKDVTTHTARHTFGTYLINKGISIEAIPKIMGHTNMTQSLLYARMLGVTAINEMRNKLIEKKFPAKEK